MTNTVAYKSKMTVLHLREGGLSTFIQYPISPCLLYCAHKNKTSNHNRYVELCVGINCISPISFGSQNGTKHICSICNASNITSLAVLWHMMHMLCILITFSLVMKHKLLLCIPTECNIKYNTYIISYQFRIISYIYFKGNSTHI